MSNPNELTVQCCSLNGKVCRNGKRDDFPKNPETGEKFVCNEWIKLVMKHPQNEGEMIDRWMCAKQASVFLLLENAQATRQNTASVDKTATEVRHAALETAAVRSVFVEAMPEETRKRIEQGIPVRLLAAPVPENADHP